MTREEKLCIRMNMLGGMEALISECGNQQLIDMWHMLALPCNPTEDDLMDIADNDSIWSFVCVLFGEIEELGVDN